MSHDGEGGLNSFADGFQVAQTLYKENPEMYSVLSTVPILSEYFDPGKYHYSSIGLTFKHHLITNQIERIRYAFNAYYMHMMKLETKVWQQQRTWINSTIGLYVSYLKKS